MSYDRHADVVFQGWKSRHGKSSDAVVAERVAVEARASLSRGRSRMSSGGTPSASTPSLSLLKPSSASGAAGMHGGGVFGGNSSSGGATAAATAATGGVHLPLIRHRRMSTAGSAASFLLEEDPSAAPGSVFTLGLQTKTPAEVRQ